MKTSFSRDRGVVEAGRTGFLAWALNLLAASSHKPQAHSDLIAAFVAVTVAGQQGNSRRHPFPLHPFAVNKTCLRDLLTVTKLSHPRDETRLEYAANSRRPYRHSVPDENATV